MVVGNEWLGWTVSRMVGPIAGAVMISVMEMAVAMNLIV